MMDKSVLYPLFWKYFCSKGPEKATIFINKNSENPAYVPVFVKFRNYKENDSFSYVCVAIQDRLKQKHLDSLKKGWPAGVKDPLVGNIWYRFLRDAAMALQELPSREMYGMTATFTPVVISSKQSAGYIILDFTTSF